MDRLEGVRKDLRGQSVTPAGHEEEGLLPVQKFRPLASMAAFWTAEPESIAIIVKEPLSRGARVGLAAAKLAKVAAIKVLENILMEFEYF